MAQTSTKRIAAVALSCYLVFLAWVLLWPSAGPASSLVDSILRASWNAGFSQELVTGPRVEFVLNATMLAPVPPLAMLAGARWTWERWTAVAFLVTGSVELFQALVLPDRSAQFQDVVSNTLGILLGSALCHPFVRPRDPGL
jgi:glycopeptide antibiotics resistance protein